MPSGLLFHVEHNPSNTTDSHRPTPRHQPAAQIHPIRFTLGDNSPVAVAVAFLTAYRATAEECAQGTGGILPAPPRLPISTAKLTTLRRVNAMKAYPLAGNFQGVAVDHAGLAVDVGQGGHRQKHHQREGDQISNHGHIFCRL